MFGDKRLTSRRWDTMRSLLAGMAVAVALAGCAGAGVKTGQYVDDSTITTKVKTALLNADNLKSTGISVTTLNGTVQLAGYTPSETDKERAAVVARDVSGVKSVENRIEVRGN